METKRNIVKIMTTMILAFLVASSAFLIFSNTSATTVAAANYGNLLQYEWPKPGADSGNTHFSAGPAPNSPDILWQKPAPTLPLIVAFSGKLFMVQGSNLLALDPFNGNVIYNVTVPSIANRTTSLGYVFKIDENRLGLTVKSPVNWPTLVGVWALRIYSTADGQLLWSDPNPKSMGGGGGFQSFNYVPEQKMAYVTLSNETGRGAGAAGVAGTVQAWDLSDPTIPTLRWTYFADGTITDWSCWGIIYGEGKIWVDSNSLHETCLNASTGKVLWETELTGATFYPGTYYNGMVLRGLLDNTFIALNATNGKILWTFNPHDYGFWSSGSSAAYGIAYEINVDGYLYALNATTGDVLWKYQGPGQFYPNYVQIADGKVYATTGEAAGSPLTPETSRSEYSCLDAYTGKVIWQIKEEFGSGPFDYTAIAYGNFYGVTTTGSNSGFGGTNTRLICFGSPKDWSMFLGNPAHTMTGYGAPTDMALKWKFATNGQVISSPAVAQGKVYVGSADKNLYCLDAENGSKIWNFTTGFRIRSSPAVVTGKVYTGADDGYVYCLDANSGQQLWKTSAPGSVLPINTAYADEFRSSPTVVGSNVYVGALDGKLYCLNANSGSVIWTLQTTGAIISSPTYIAGDGLYFASVDGFVYKVNADSGSVIWNQSTPIGREITMMGTPTVGGGMVFIGSGAASGGPARIGQFYALNATTGAFVWKANQLAGSGSLEPIWSMLYLDGKVYFGDFFSFSCANATTGTKLWSCFLTREHIGSPAYSDGNFYVPSDSYGVYVVNSAGNKTGYFETAAQVRSSVAIYESKLYFGSNDWNVYCLEAASFGTTYIGNPSPSPSPSPSVQPTATPSPVVIPTPTPTMVPTPIVTSTPSAVVTPTPTTPQGPGGIPASTVYAIAAAAIIIVIVAVAAITLRRRK